MAEERADSTWSVERIDDLAAEVRSQRIELSGRVDALSARIDAQGSSLGARIDALQRSLLAMTLTLVVGFAGLIGTQL